MSCTFQHGAARQKPGPAKKSRGPQNIYIMKNASTRLKTSTDKVQTKSARTSVTCMHIVVCVYMRNITAKYRFLHARVSAHCALFFPLFDEDGLGLLSLPESFDEWSLLVECYSRVKFLI